MLCSEIMTRNPEYCLPSDSVMKAAQLMKSKDVGPIPIVDDKDGKRLTGIITDRDLAIKVVAEARDPNTTTVTQVMTGDVATCKESDDVEKALKLMEHRQVRRIPIVDDDKRLMGIIAQADVATRIEGQQKTGEVVEEISKAA